MTPNEFANMLVSETDQAIRQFGEYTFSDKGPHEVLDVGVLADILRKKEAVDAGSCLQAAAECGKRYSKVASAVMSCLDDTPEEWWVAFCEAAPAVSF